MEPRKNYTSEQLEIDAALSRRFQRDPNVKLSINECCEDISVLLDKYDWFYDALPENGKIVVYCNKINASVMEAVPTKSADYNITLAFSGYLECTNNYGPNNKNIIWLYKS